MSVDPVVRSNSVTPSAAGAAPSGALERALSGSCEFANEQLPETLPANPMEMFGQWLAEAGAKKTQPNPNSMTLSTVDPDGRPSARIVLCRGVSQSDGTIFFYTNYTSRKGVAIELRGYASLLFHWDHLDRQVRMEGPVVRTSAAESDAYFARRPVMSRVAAWASDQSAPIGSRAELLERNAEVERRFGITRNGDGDAGVVIPDGLVVPRPPHWGGYTLWAEHVELWLGHSWRLHDRARWSRELTRGAGVGKPAYTPGPWSATRLQP